MGYLTLSEVSTSLGQLVDGAHNSVNDQHFFNSLVVNPYNTSIYHTRSVEGTVYKCYYMFKEMFGFENEQISKIEYFQKLYDSFNYYTDLSSKHFRNYKKYCTDAAEGKFITDEDQKKVSKSSSCLFEWLNVVDPYLHAIKKRKNVLERIQSVASYLTTFEEARQLCLDLKLLYLHEFLKPSSIEALAELSRTPPPKLLSNTKEWEIQKWIVNIVEKCKSQKTFNVRIVGKALKELINVLGGEARYDWLLEHLQKRGCTLLLEQDFKHTYRYNQSKIEKVVGKKLKEVPGTDKNGFKVFQIEEEKNTLVYVGSSKVDLYIRFLSKDFSSLEVLEMDPKGRYAIVKSIE